MDIKPYHTFREAVGVQPGLWRGLRGGRWHFQPPRQHGHSRCPCPLGCWLFGWTVGFLPSRKYTLMTYNVKCIIGKNV